jgi:hypothetical protein
MKKHYILLILSIFLVQITWAQVDSLQTDTPVVQVPAIQDNNKEVKKRVSDFKVHGGLSVSSILLSGGEAESAYAAGYVLGASYRRGKNFYWELGEYQDTTKSKNAALFELKEWMDDFVGIAKIALYDKPQLLEVLGIFVRS